MTYHHNGQNTSLDNSKQIEEFSDPENPKEKEEYEEIKDEQSIDQKFLRNNEAFISILTSLSGDMDYLKDRISLIPGLHGDIIRILDAWLRGIGQVGFMNNPVCGAGILACGLWDSTWITVCGMISSLWVTILAYLFVPSKRDLHRDGLLTFNPYLLGACWATFLLSPWDFRLIVMILFYSPIVLVTQLAFIKVLGKVDSPAFTIPYIVHALFFLIANYNFRTFGEKAPPMILAPHTTLLEFSPEIALDAFSQGVGQVYFIANTWPGLATLLCYTLYSPFHGLAAALGSAMGGILGYVFFGNMADIQAGLWGFNPVLTFLALFAVFIDRSWASFIYGFFGCLATVVLYGGLKAVFTLGAIPTLTLPFSIATVFFMIARESFAFPSSAPAPLPLSLPPSKDSKESKDECSRLFE